MFVHKNGHAEGDICCAANEAGKKVRALFDQASDQASDAIASTEKQIRSNPVAASLIAAGIGYVLGKLFGSRR